MLRRPIGRIACTLLLACVAPTALAQEADAPLLRFDWPIGLKGKVTQTMNRTQGPVSRDSETTYDFELKEAADGLIIDTSNASTKTDLSQVPPQMQNVLKRLMGVMPDYKVSRGGEFVGAADLEKLQAEIRGVMDSLLSEMPESMRPQMQQVMSQVTSEEALLAQLSETWNVSVAMWIDAEPELGEVYQLEFEEPHPMAPQIMLPQTLEFSLQGREPCKRGGKERRCVRLSVTSTPDPAKLGEATMAILQQFNGGQPLPDEALASMKEMSMREDIDLVTEPDTLIPHKLTKIKTISMDLSAVGQPSMERVDRTEVTYTYAP